MRLYPSRKLIERSDIRSLVIRQSISQLKKLNPPQLLIIDSYSELTDQEFLLPNKAKFYCNYSDLFPGRDLIVKSNGLLDLGSLDDYYETFLLSVMEKWGGCRFCALLFDLSTKKAFQRKINMRKNRRKTFLFHPRYGKFSPP
jgi:hypothetical protein